MNTPAHMLIGAAVFGRNRTPSVVAWAMIGALLPDASLYLIAGVSLFFLQIPPQVVFDELYFSDAWQTIFAVDNSFLIWGGLFAVALLKGGPKAIALTGAGLLHLCLDFPLHHDDGRAHFWPLSNWVFESPVSYWDKSHGAFWIAPIEAVMATSAAFLVWRQKLGWKLSGVTLALLTSELWILRQWLYFFIDG